MIENGDSLVVGFLAVNVLPLKILGEIPGVNPLILMKLGGLTLCISWRMLFLSDYIDSICIKVGLLAGLMLFS